MDDDEELQLSLHLDGQYKTATLPKGLYHAARHSGWKIARHCIIIVFDVINQNVAFICSKMLWNEIFLWIFKHCALML